MDANDELLALADRIDADERTNALDVAIDLVLFRPCAHYVAIRANSAGTKAIYTDKDGNDHTHWSIDWSALPETAPALRSLAARAVA
ncbi:MAG: hypothetical protein ACKVOB_13390 [Sphingomonas sp.]